MRVAAVLSAVLASWVTLALATPPVEPVTECQKWMPGPRTAPPPSAGHAMSYDQRRGVTVVQIASRYYLNEFPPETWEWNGQQWSLRSRTGPDQRLFAAMTYDSRRGVTVFFGGSEYPNSRHDTWEWDGEVWTHRTDEGPEGFDNPRLVFDGRRGDSILFGIREPNYPESAACETWSWDGEAWSLLDLISPCPINSLEGLAYDQRRGVVVMLGGVAYQSQETWEWDGSTWQVREVQFDEYFHSHERELTYDTRRGLTVASGGSRWETQTREWDGSTWTVRQLEAGGPIRRWHALSFDQRRGVTMLFGGLGRNNVAKEHAWDDIWEYDGQSWNRRAVGAPQSCSGANPTYDQERGLTIVEVSGRLWEVRDDRWTEIAYPDPAFQTLGPLIFDERRAVTLFLGVMHTGATEPTPVLWEWDGEDWTKQEAFGAFADGPLPMAYDSRRAETLVLAFAGAQGSGALWSWNGTVWRQVSSGVPSSRWNAAMVYDRRRDRLVFVGEGDESDTPIYLWEWDGVRWSRVGSTGPAPFFGGSFVFDEAREMAVLRQPRPPYGQYFDDWEWNGVAWEKIERGGPEYQSGTMVFDWRKNRLVLFGANCGFGDPPTWELRPREGVSDIDSDCDTDLADFAAYQNCVSREGDAAACREAGIGSSDSAAWADLKEFLNRWDGPSNDVP